MPAVSTAWTPRCTNCTAGCSARGLDRLMLAVYQRIWDQEISPGPHDDLARKLSRLPYLDRRAWPDAARRFAELVRPVLDELSGKEDQGPRPTGAHGLDQFTSEEIDHGLKELAASAGSPDQFAEVVEDFDQELERRGFQGRAGLGGGPGETGPAFYYMKLAENYLLPVRKKPIRSSGALYPHRHQPWEADKPVVDVDPLDQFRPHSSGA